MLEYLSYITLFCVVVVSITYLYIKAKFGFWMIQPVFHVYDIGYMISAPGIINHGLPAPNKYTNFKNVDTVVYAELSEFKITKFAKFIQTHYLNYKANIFSPTVENISPYFYGHSSKSFISFYNEDNLLTDFKTGTTINESKIIGVMTGRPLHVVINTNESNGNEPKFDVYYIDYLCVDKSYRKKGIAPEVIQTHYYNQSHINQNITVNLFKREDELTGIVPLCVYSTYGFSVNTWTKPVDLLPMYKLVEINAHNFHLLFSFIQDNSHHFDILIYSETTNMVELIKTKNVFIYTIVVQNEIVCAYFFRKSCVFVDKDLEVLSCFASINNYHDPDIFIRGFKISFWKIAEANKFGYSSIENISHNNVIIDNLRIKTKPLIISPTAYFFYNFAYRTFSCTKVLIIN
jgi:hypothetical protein